MTSTVPASPLTVRLQDRYRIERQLGRGGMGAVYLARDLRLDRLVAIKELPAELVGDVLLRERFLREVRTAAGFSHPNIVPVHGVEEQPDALAFIMGFVEGESLADRVRRSGPLDTREAVRLLQDVSYALAYAHGRGVVHRDIKPDNIMIERATGRALLMDFGVARAISTAPAIGDGMTRVGEVVGTPEYMSPEQATGDTIDGRSDLYSLGLTAYFAVTGEIAYGGDSVQRILVRQLTEVLPPLESKRPDLPPALCAVVDRCLLKDRDARFATAEALVDALDAAQAAVPDVALPVRLFAQELESLSLIGLFLAVFMATLFTSISASNDWLDAMLPLTVLLAIMLGRLLQTRAEAARLRADGFTPEAMRNGFRVVLAERDARRRQLRNDPQVVQRRRRTMLLSGLMVIGAAILLASAWRFRVPRPTGGFETPLPGVVMLFSGLALFGMGFVLLMRSPFRAPVPERLFRIVAFGPVGRWLMGTSRGESVPRAGGATAPAPAVTARPPAAPAAPAATRDATVAALHAIEARLERIETRLGDRR